MSGCRVVVHAANEVPQQGNTVDCGVFCVAMARCIAEGRAFDFMQENVPLLRRRLALSIARVGPAGKDKI